MKLTSHTIICTRSKKASRNFQNQNTTCLFQLTAKATVSPVCLSPSQSFYIPLIPPDTKNYTNFTVQEYKLKTAGPHDVTLSIDFCGVCGSDVHTVTGGWGPLSADWICPGHEIIGKVTHVGEEVTEFKVGQRVGVGAQVYSCLKCERCKSDNEQYCPELVEWGFSSSFKHFLMMFLIQHV